VNLIFTNGKLFDEKIKYQRDSLLSHVHNKYTALHVFPSNYSHL